MIKYSDTSEAGEASPHSAERPASREFKQQAQSGAVPEGTLTPNISPNSGQGQGSRDPAVMPEPATGFSASVGEEALVRLALILSSSDDAITGETLDGIVTHWNEGAEKLFGYSAQE